MNTKFEVIDEIIDQEVALNFSLIPREKEVSVSIFETAKQINAAIEFVNNQLIDREEIVRQSFYAFLTGEHQLVLSRTGMAKSLLARQIFSCFGNAVVFEKQLTKDTMPDNLFGAYDIDQMKRGKIFHNVEGSIVLADFAFLDEIFDANDMLLRSLLSLLNEKRLINGEQQIRSSLSSVIAATNYLRATEMMEAVLDRFLYKSFIPENKNLYTQLAIDRVYQEHYGVINLPKEKIDLDSFLLLQKVIKSQTVEIPKYILFLKNYILRKYIEETRSMDAAKSNYTISDRTSVKIQDLLRASAVLDFRLEVEEKDLNQMYYLVCMVGKKEEKDRLLGIIDSSLRYFGCDKEVLEETFELMGLLNDLRLSGKNGQNTLADDGLFKIMDKIENNLKEKGNFGQKLYKFASRFTSKIIPFSNKSEISNMLNIIYKYCDLLKDMAAKKETLEFIDGLEQDIEDFQPQVLLN